MESEELEETPLAPLEIVKILVASDVHAGYGETKKHIHNDSFSSFEEVLKNGADNDVDFVLLAGDLFHENNPSRETQLKMTRLLRRYSYRSKPLGVEFVSDPSVNFHHSNFPTVNYEDENLNVGMPVFTIHGNHDDLSGKGLTALDVFHETGLINLFGKFNDVDQIEVAPILLRKGRTKIAIYGISSQRDDRLSRAFMNESVKFLRPDSEPDSWFSILVVHQNRPRRSTSRTTGAFLPIMFIPPFFDLVIWGHEHECLIDPQYFTVGEDANGDTGFFIIQPGSTVATSLCREEAVPKHCAVLKIKGREFKSEKIRLESTRQVIIDELSLDDSLTMRKVARSTVRQKNMPDEELIAQRIEELLQDAEATRRSRQPQPPLIRLKVTYSGKWLNIPPINGRRFGARYADRVANASDMIAVRSIRPEKSTDATGDPINAVLGETIDEIHSVDQMVEKYFGECSFDDKMSVLTEVAMSRSMKEYSNVDATYTAADRSLTDSIKNQIQAFTGRLQCASEKMLEVDKMDDTTLAKRVERIVAEMKRQQSGVIPTQTTAPNFADSVNSAASSGPTVVSRNGQMDAPSASPAQNTTADMDVTMDEVKTEADSSVSKRPPKVASIFHQSNAKPNTSAAISARAGNVQFHGSTRGAVAGAKTTTTSKREPPTKKTVDEITLGDDDDFDEDIFD